MQSTETPKQAPAQSELPLNPGQVLELDRLGALLDEARMALADLKLGKAQGDYALFEANAHKFAGLANHFAKLVTNHRPRPPQRVQKE